MTELVYERTPENCVAPKIRVKPFPEYYDIRTELSLVPTTTMDISCMVILTSTVNYSSNQRYLGSRPQGSVLVTMLILDPSLKAQCERRHVNGLDSWTEVRTPNWYWPPEFEENCLLSILTSMLLTGDKRIQSTNIIKDNKKEIVHFPHGVGPSMKGADTG